MDAMAEPEYLYPAEAYEIRGACFEGIRPVNPICAEGEMLVGCRDETSPSFRR